MIDVLSFGPAIVKSKSQSSSGGNSWDGKARFRSWEPVSDEHDDILERVQASKGTTPAATGSTARYVRLQPAVPAAGNAGNVSVARKTEQVGICLVLLCHGCQLN